MGFSFLLIFLIYFDVVEDKKYGKIKVKVSHLIIE